MTTDLDLDRVLGAWLAEGAERAPAGDVAAALRQVEATGQRRAVPAGRANRWASVATERLWLAAAAILVAVLGAVAAFGGGSVPVAARSVGAGDFPFTAAVPVPDTVAFTALLPAGAPENLYWRGAAYNSFELDGWTQSDVQTVAVPAGEPLLTGSAELPPEGRTTDLRVTIKTNGFVDHTLLSPGVPVTVDADATVSLVGGWFADAQLPDGTSYTVEARVPRPDDTTGISGNQLRVAGADYPPELAERYTAVPPAALGPAAHELLQAILDSTPSRDPYDLAAATEAYLRDPAHFSYSPDITQLPCDSTSIVECFAQNRVGFCIHYASTMAILLRAALPDRPIPTRLVQGFLPGTRSGNLETVPTFAAHAWVEVYFPGVGWIRFDPTPRVDQLVAIPVGPPLSSLPSTRLPSASLAPPSGDGQEGASRRP